MDVAADPFELACLDCTLRTLRIMPRDILVDPNRLPPNENDPLLDLARPTWIGKEFRVGGVLLLAKNPAGGSPSHRFAPNSLDAMLANALKNLSTRQVIAFYRVWRDLHRPPTCCSAVKRWVAQAQPTLLLAGGRRTGCGCAGPAAGCAAPDSAARPDCWSMVIGLRPNSPMWCLGSRSGIILGRIRQRSPRFPGLMFRPIAR